ncbi:MAG: Nonlabens phage [Chloroflexota bacterium]|jgi:hypothetical protein
MAVGLYSGASGLALGRGLYRDVSGLWAGSSGLIAGFGGTAFSPLSLFAAGEPGAWYDPSDLSTMFQDSAGTTPVTATGQTVGLLLDKSKGLVLGPELVTNGDFSNGSTGWTASSVTVSGGVASWVASSGTLEQDIVIAAGKTYALTYTVSGYVSGNVTPRFTGGTPVIGVGRAANGTFTEYMLAVADASLRFVGGVFTGSLDNISVRELPGNHASQSVLANRPIYGIEPFGGRRNLLVRTEEFQSSAWAKFSASVTADSTTAPDGTLTADKVTALGDWAVLQTFSSATVGQTYTFSVWIKVPSPRTVQLVLDGAFISVSATAEWNRFSITKVAANTSFTVAVRRNTPGAETGFETFVWGAQLETGSTATAYQQVTDQWNVTEAGKPSVSYLAGDFVDDRLIFNGSTAVACESAYVTENGWMVSGASGSNYGTLSRIPLGRVAQYVVNPNIKINADQLTSYFGVPQYYFVGMTTDSTVLHNIVSSAGPYPITYVGSNGVTYTQTANNVTTDLIAQGLTSPFTMLVPKAVISDTALSVFDCYNNQLTGSIPSLTANTALTAFRCYNNQLTGSIPSLSANTALSVFNCYNNQLTGSIPSLSANTALSVFLCFGNQLTGSIPSLTANTALTDFRCFGNQLTGSIPSLSANTALSVFYCYTNQLTGWSGGTVSATLGDFQAQNNLLTQAAVDAILAAFVAAGRTTGTRNLNLGGTGNATPSATGLTDKATLQSRGWTVTTN